MYQVKEQDIQIAVNDFEVFCGFLEDKQPVLSARKVMLGKSASFEVNALLHHRKEVSAPKYLQESYPIVNLMFHLVINGKLYVRKGDEKGKVHLVATPKKAAFDRLNTFEKYVFLLETLWIWEDLEHLETFGDVPIDIAVRGIAASSPGEVLVKGAFSGESEMDPLFSYHDVIIHCLEYFGFCRLVPVLAQKALTKYHDSIQEVIPTPLGVRLCQILSREKFYFWNIPFVNNCTSEDQFIPGIPALFLSNDEQLAEDVYNERQHLDHVPFYQCLQKAFPLGTLQHTLTAEDDDVRVKGNYLFKVALGKTVWRTIELSDQHSLHDLHLAIQEAFDFGNDHLYSFFMDAKRYSKHEYNSPEGGEGPYADEAIIGDLNLYEHQKLLYLFDYGDSWEFDIKLLSVRENELPIQEPHIVESKGAAPDQYPDYDDDDEW